MGFATGSLSDLLRQCQNIENCAKQITAKIAKTNRFSEAAIDKINPLIYRSLCKNVFVGSDQQSSAIDPIELINRNQDLIAENLNLAIKTNPNNSTKPFLRKSKSIIKNRFSFDHLNQANVSLINKAIEQSFDTKTNESENVTWEEDQKSGAIEVRDAVKPTNNPLSQKGL